jgi:hypothetical protein
VAVPDGAPPDTLGGWSIALSGPILYFAPPPLSTCLLSVRCGENTFTGVDADVWAHEFLRLFETLLRKRFAIARFDRRQQPRTAYCRRLLEARHTLATAIASRLAPLFADLPPAPAALAEARRRFGERLLNRPFAPLTTAVVVAVPAVVTAGEGAGPHMSLYGRITALSEGSRTECSRPMGPHQGTFSSGDLTLSPGSQWLITTMTAADATVQRAIAPALEFLPQGLCQTEERGLRLVTRRRSRRRPVVGAPPLRLPDTSGETSIPVPFISVPAPPRLLTQSAQAAVPPQTTPSGRIRDQVADALRWRFRASLSHEWVAQDDLFMRVSYNAPGGCAAHSHRPASSSECESADCLVRSLAAFDHCYTKIAPRLDAILATPGASGTPPSHRRKHLMEALTSSVTGVAEAWQSIGNQCPTVADVTPSSPIDEFRIRRTDNHLEVTAFCGELEPSWPTILTGDGTIAIAGERTAAGDTITAIYELAPPLSPAPELRELAFEWGPLRLTERHRARLQARVIRNAYLIDGRPTAPAFVYSTETVGFGDSIGPLAIHAQVAVLPGTGLRATVEEIVEPFFAGTMMSRLHIEVRYSWASAGEANRVSLPIALTVHSAAPPARETVDELAQQISSRIIAWRVAQQLPLTDARLDFGLRLFGTPDEQSPPLADIGVAVDLNQIGPDWWSKEGVAGTETRPAV